MYARCRIASAREAAAASTSNDCKSPTTGVAPSCDTFAADSWLRANPSTTWPARTAFSTTTLPMYPLAPATKIFIDHSFASGNRNIECLKRLSDEFFAFLPKRLSIFRIERISAHSFADGADRHVVGNNPPDVAILAIPAANLVSGCHDTGPHGSRGSLRNGLPLEGPLTLSRKLLVHLFHDPLNAARIYVATQFGLYASRMHSRAPHATLALPLVERHAEHAVCRLRSALRDGWLIGRPLKVGILKVNVRETVTGRRQIDQSPSCAKKARNPVHQDKVAEVIGAELCFKAVRCMSERCRHHSCIGDDHVERIALCQ